MKELFYYNSNSKFRVLTLLFVVFIFLSCSAPKSESEKSVKWISNNPAIKMVGFMVLELPVECTND
ncbi:MAG: hypothetical protein U0T69_09000 [Chitinophagales bacterium]